MNPKAESLKARAHDFFIRVIRLCRDIPPSAAADSIVEQLLDSAGSSDSNYGAACKARSRREFIAKVGVAAEQADESLGKRTARCRAGAPTTPAPILNPQSVNPQSAIRQSPIDNPSIGNPQSPIVNRQTRASPLGQLP